MIRVICADDNVHILEAMKTLFRQRTDMCCDHFFSSADSVIAHLDKAAAADLPDVIILDWSMPGMHVPHAIQIIAARWPSCRVIVLSAHETEEVQNQAIEAGAWGFVGKSFQVDCLLNAIRTVANQEMVLTQ
jgi:two-component system, NarL family, invasion response regulator UvrY